MTQLDPPGSPGDSSAAPKDQSAALPRLSGVLPERLRPRDSEEKAADDAGAAPPALLPYPKLPPETFKTVRVTGQIIAYASPDSTFPVTKKLIDSARHSIVIGIYDFNASYIKEPLKDAMRRGVSVSLMLDLNSDDQPNLFNELKALGANCVVAATKSNPVKYFENAHEKIICCWGNPALKTTDFDLHEKNSLITGEFGLSARQFQTPFHYTAVQHLQRRLSAFLAPFVSLRGGMPPRRSRSPRRMFRLP